jgi:hypothetical protein
LTFSSISTRPLRALLFPAHAGVPSGLRHSRRAPSPANATPGMPPATNAEGTKG